VDIAGELTKAMEETVTGVGRAIDLVGEIAVASREKPPRWTRRTPTAVVTDGDFDELNV